MSLNHNFFIYILVNISNGLARDAFKVSYKWMDLKVLALLEINKRNWPTTNDFFLNQLATQQL